MHSHLLQAVTSTPKSANGSQREAGTPSDQIIKQMNIESMVNAKAGTSIVCPLSDHNDTDPSFRVHGGDKGWYCYGCNRGGSVIDYVMHRDGIDHKAAIHKLADTLGIQIVPEVTVIDFPKDTPEATVTPYTLETVAEARKRPAQGYIVEGIIPAGGRLVEVIAPRGVGKSWLTLSLTLACHTGQTKWMGHTLIPTNALYVPLEAPYTVEPRATIWGFTHRANVDNFAYVTETRLGLLADGGARLIATIAEHDAGLVVLDAWRQVLEGASDEDKDVAPKLLNLIQQIAVHTGATIILLHNTGWQATGRARGLSAFEDAADVILTLAEAGDQIKVETTKNRLGPEPAPWYLKLDRTGGGVPSRYDGVTVIDTEDRIKADILAALQGNAGLTKNGLNKAVTGRKAAVIRAADELVDSGQVVVDDGLFKQPKQGGGSGGSGWFPEKRNQGGSPVPDVREGTGNYRARELQVVPEVGTTQDTPGDAPAGCLFDSPEPPPHRDPA